MLQWVTNFMSKSAGLQRNIDMHQAAGIFASNLSAILGDKAAVARMLPHLPGDACSFRLGLCQKWPAGAGIAALLMTPSNVQCTAIFSINVDVLPHQHSLASRVLDVMQVLLLRSSKCWQQAHPQINKHHLPSQWRRTGSVLMSRMHHPGASGRSGPLPCLAGSNPNSKRPPQITHTSFASVSQLSCQKRRPRCVCHTSVTCCYQGAMSCDTCKICHMRGHSSYHFEKQADMCKRLLIPTDGNHLPDVMLRGTLVHHCQKSVLVMQESILDRCLAASHNPALFNLSQHFGTMIYEHVEALADEDLLVRQYLETIISTHTSLSKLSDHAQLCTASIAQLSQLAASLPDMHNYSSAHDAVKVRLISMREQLATCQHYLKFLISDHAMRLSPVTDVAGMLQQTIACKEHATGTQLDQMLLSCHELIQHGRHQALLKHFAARDSALYKAYLQHSWHQELGQIMQAGGRSHVMLGV